MKKLLLPHGTRDLRRGESHRAAPSIDNTRPSIDVAFGPIVDASDVDAVGAQNDVHRALGLTAESGAS